MPSFFASIAEELIRPAGITTLFVVVMGLLACDKSTWIRVQNGTTYDFDEVVVATPGARHAFSKLSAGASTDYRDFDETYRYAYVSLRIGEATFVLQPIDYTGEKRLETGRHTYVVSVTDFDRRLLAIRVVDE